MKVNIVDEDNIIVFLSKFLISDVDFSCKNSLEEEFKNVFLKLSNYYGIVVNGYYDVCVYVDEHYGSILEISRDDVEYGEFLVNQVDMRIVVANYKTFLYELDDILDIDITLLNKNKVIKYKNKYYLKVNNAITSYEMGSILEVGNIIYGREVDNIMRFGKILEFKQICVI